MRAVQRHRGRREGERGHVGLERPPRVDRRPARDPSDRHVRAKAPLLGLEADRGRRAARRDRPAAPPARRPPRARPTGRPGRRGGSHSAPAVRSSPSGPATPAEQRAGRRRVLARARAEERERDVQVLRGHAPHAGGRRGLAPRRQRRARVGGQVERDEEPHHPSPSSSRRTRWSATVVERSRTSARPPGSSPIASARRPSRWLTDSQTSPTGLSSVAPPGPAMPVMPTPTSASSALARAVGERLGHLRARPRRRARAAPRRPRRARPSPRWSTRRARPARPPRSPVARSAARTAGLRCRTPRRRSSRPCRAAARRPARRPSCRRPRTASRRGARGRSAANAS